MILLRFYKWTDWIQSDLQHFQQSDLSVYFHFEIIYFISKIGLFYINYPPNFIFIIKLLMDNLHKLSPQEVKMTALTLPKAQTWQVYILLYLKCRTTSESVPVIITPIGLIIVSSCIPDVQHTYLDINTTLIVLFDSDIKLLLNTLVVISLYGKHLTKSYTAALKCTFHIIPPLEHQQILSVLFSLNLHHSVFFPLWLMLKCVDSSKNQRGPFYPNSITDAECVVLFCQLRASHLTQTQYLLAC